MRKVYSMLLVCLIHLTLKAQTDVTTQYITNSDMASTEGWQTNMQIMPSTSSSWKPYPNFDGDFMEIWTSVGSSLSQSYAYQEVEVPNGGYIVSAHVIACQQASKTKNSQGVTLYANDASVECATYNGIPEYYSVYTTVTDGKLRVGLNVTQTTANWAAWDNIKIESVDGDLSELGTQFYRFIKKVENTSFNALSDDIKKELEEALVNANPKASNADIENQMGHLEQAYDAALKNENDSLLHAITQDGSCTIQAINDKKYPWTVADGYAYNGNDGYSKTISSIQFQYASDYKTEVSVNWARYAYYSNSHFLWMYVDGALFKTCTSSSDSQVRFFLPEGTHFIEFRDSINSSYSLGNDWSRISNLKVREIVDVASTVLTENSLPITFTNCEDYPWTTEDGYIRSSNYGVANSASQLSATVTVDKPSLLSFSSAIGRTDYTSYYENEHSFKFYIDGELYASRYTGSGTTSVVLLPGTHDLEWTETINNYSNGYYATVSNMKLISEWTEVEVSTPGTLGVEVLYLVNVLSDVELLKIKGTINEKDWAVIKQMNNLTGLDLSEAGLNDVPASAFENLAYLSYVTLPEGTNTIGDNAFKGTQILQMDIPSSVTSIGNSAFSGTRIRSVNFKEDSQLNTIYYEAFRNCTSLKEFIMPHTVTRLGLYGNKTDYANYEANTFRGCTSLEVLHLSDSLAIVPQSICYDCTSLAEVYLPTEVNTISPYAFYNTKSLCAISLPESLRDIGHSAFEYAGIDSLILPVKLTTLANYAFAHCSNLEYIELPSYLPAYDYNFRYCSNIKTIVCQSATPPAITNDPLGNGASKSGITLYVPNFAVANYKLDPYWFLFGNIQEMDATLDYWRISGDLMLTNNRRMEGKPDLDLYYGGQLTVSGNAPMEVSDLNLFVSEGNPGRLLNNCESFTADSVTTHFSVSANTWYFITPLHDTKTTDITHSANASFVFRYYNGQQRATSGTGNSWQNVSDGMLHAGQGYIFQCNANGTVVMPAVKEKQDAVFHATETNVVLSTYESDNTANKSWNYVGNPYPCYYDIYYMDFTAPITIRSGSNYYAYSISDDDYVLRPMQSFFVQKPDEVDNIIFRPEGRQLSPTVNRVSYVAKRNGNADVSRYIFDIELRQGESYDRTRIVLNEAKSLAYDLDCDAAKFMSDDATMGQIFTTDEKGTRLAINERPRPNDVIALGVITGQAGTYTVSSPRHAFPLYLHDTETGTTTDLSQKDYTFNAENGVEMSNRFTLSFAVTPPTGIKESQHQHIQVSGSFGTLTVSAPDGCETMVYNAEGKLVATSTGNAVFNLSAGIYIVKANGQTIKAVVR